MTKVVHVAAGVIRNSSGQILIAKRPDDTHQGGLWEFPGGKLEPGESVQSALIRELQEELGINSTELSPLIQIRHDYPDKSVLLDVWNVTAFDGDAQGREGQPVKWVAPRELDDYQFPAANTPIVMAAQLPERLLITGAEDSAETFLNKLESVLEQGFSLIQLRQKHWDHSQWQAALPHAMALCRDAGARLLLNTPPQNILEQYLDDPVCALGIHLTSHQLGQMDASLLNALKDRALCVSASCHSSEELLNAEELGVDFVTLSPVEATSTHPDQAPMGWDEFETLVQGAKLPVFALGGLTGEHLKNSRNRGGQGVAAISAWWPQ